MRHDAGLMGVSPTPYGPIAQRRMGPYRYAPVLRAPLRKGSPAGVDTSAQLCSSGSETAVPVLIERLTASVNSMYFTPSVKLV